MEGILKIEIILLLPRSTKHRSYMSAKDLLKLVEIVGFEKQEKVFGEGWK